VTMSGIAWTPRGVWINSQAIVRLNTNSPFLGISCVGGEGLEPPTSSV
jgi:hypothetical protein